MKFQKASPPFWPFLQSNGYLGEVDGEGNI